MLATLACILCHHKKAIKWVFSWKWSTCFGEEVGVFVVKFRWCEKEKVIHYQKFAKYQRISRRNISVGNLRSELPTDTFPSIIQSVTTDGKFSVRNSVGNYRQKYSVGSYRLNYGRKSFRIKKKTGRWRGGFGGSFFSDDITDGFKNDSLYSDVTGAPFTLPTDSPRDLKWQIRTVMCLCFRQNHRRNIRRWNRR